MDLYRFELLESAPDKVRVKFEPKEANAQRMQGIATIDPITGHVLHLDASPSDLPFGLDSLKLDVVFASTPCGNTVKSLVVDGKVKVLFYSLLFRSSSEFSAYEKVESSKTGAVPASAK